MARSKNAQLAVDQYCDLNERHAWNKSTAWKGIALLLLTCDRWVSGWQPFHGVVVFREVNDYPKVGKSNKTLERAQSLSDYLADELGVKRDIICQSIGLYWREPRLVRLQPNNPVGHAFRSIAVTILQLFGDPAITYEEEVSPTEEFPGFKFPTRSKKAKIDIIARRGMRTVAVISSRWRFRHDRVDVHEEALAYISAAQRHNRNCKLYAFVGEFAPNRLNKILDSCKPESNAPLDAAVHFAPQLISEGLGENGRLKHLRSLEWLVDETYRWR